MQHINNAHLSWLQCREELDSLLVIIDSVQVNFALHDSIVSGKNRQLTLQVQAITDRDTLIGAQSILIKDQAKTIKKQKAQKTILGISCGVLGVIVLALLL